MSSGLYSHTTRATGTILTAAIYNSDHQNHITNQNPLMTGAYSDNLSEHQANSDPGGLGTEVLPGNLAEELEQIRFCLKRIIGEAQWYIPPVTDLASVGGSITNLEVAETVKFLGAISPAQITVNQNNYAPTGHADAFRFRLNSDASRDITGLAGPVAGRVVILENIGSQDIILRNENAASTAANRFLFGADVNIRPSRSLALYYDGTSSRWRMIGGSLPANMVLDGNLTISGNLSGLVNITQTGYTDQNFIAAPSAPAANNLRFYTKDTGAGVLRPAFKNSAGVETVIGSSAPTLQVFTGSGTWTKPAGLSAVIVHVLGGGGDASSGVGGTSSFGAHCSATGGAANGGAAGAGSGGDINLAGEIGTMTDNGSGAAFGKGGRGAGPFGGGGQGSLTALLYTGPNYGAGGLNHSGSVVFAGSGGGYALKHIAAGSLGATETVTIGAGGTGGAGGDSGAPGIVVVEEYY